MNSIPFIWYVSESKVETIKRCYIKVYFKYNCKNTTFILILSVGCWMLSLFKGLNFEF